MSSQLRRLGLGKFLSVSRFRMRKGLPPAPSSSGPLTDEPDWSHLDGTPGIMTKGQSLRYLRDQDFGRTIVKFNEQFKAIAEARKKVTSGDTTATSNTAQANK